MQYIEKKIEEPVNWQSLLTTSNGRRATDFKNWCSNAGQVNILELRRILLKEQFYLCAYCQAKISETDCTIEHILPKSLCNEESLNYYNLLVTCNADEHCNTYRSSRPIIPIIRYKNCDCNDHGYHPYFQVTKQDYKVLVHNIRNQSNLDIFYCSQLFIDVTNLNHKNIILNRKKAVESLLLAIRPKYNNNSLKPKQMLRKILANKGHQYRIFLRLYF